MMAPFFLPLCCIRSGVEPFSCSAKWGVVSFGLKLRSCFLQKVDLIIENHRALTSPQKPNEMSTVNEINLQLGHPLNKKCYCFFLFKYTLKKLLHVLVFLELSKLQIKRLQNMRAKDFLLSSVWQVWKSLLAEILFLFWIKDCTLSTSAKNDQGFQCFLRRSVWF